MKYLGYTIFVLLFLSSCTSIRKVLDAGDVRFNQDVHVIPIDFAYGVPLCIVSIDGKMYKFLIDTGAPTCISEELFAELGLKIKASLPVRDSQKNRQKQNITSIARMEVGDLVYTDVGCLVVNFNKQEMIRCLGLDGIIGSNTMSKAFWSFDYSNEKIRVHKNLDKLNLTEFEYVLPFKHSLQKTPKIEGSIAGKNISFTFDTGSNGYFSVVNDSAFYAACCMDSNWVSFLGSRSAGIFGLEQKHNFFTMKNDVTLNTHRFSQVMINGGKSNLIGNQFLKHFVFLIDWVDKNIYLKKVMELENKPFTGFGFNYLIIDGKYKVSYICTDYQTELKIGDEIISLDEENFTHFNFDALCERIFYKERLLPENAILDITVVRNADTLSYELQRRVYIP